MKKLVILFSLLFLIGCTNHQHEFKIEIINPTCLENGYTEYKCSCGYKYRNNTIKPLGHDYSEWNIIYNSTCNKHGKKEKYCSRCNNIITANINKLDCDFIYQVISKPTFLESGLLGGVCEHGLVDNVCVLPSFSSGRYNSKVINKPKENELGIRRHKIDINNTEYIFYEEFEGINDDRFKYVYQGIDIKLSGNLYFVEGDLIIPEKVTTISNNVFKNVNINNLIFPSTVKEIRSGSFTNCNINYLFISESIIEISVDSFSDCIIKEIYVDENNPNYILVDNLLIDKNTKEVILEVNYGI